jgi:hypothetical protein
MWQLVCFDSWVVLHDSWARNQVGIVFSYRPARLHKLSESSPWNRFLSSIEVLKYRLCKSFSLNNFTAEVEVLKTEQPLPHDAGFGVQNLPLYCTTPLSFTASPSLKGTQAWNFFLTFSAETESLWSQGPVTRDFWKSSSILPRYSTFKHFRACSACDEIGSQYAQHAMKPVPRTLSVR